MNTMKSLVAAGVTALLMAAPAASHAAVSLCLDDGVGGFNGGGIAAKCIADGGADDMNTAAGAITFMGSYGGFSFNISSALGEPYYTGGLGMDLFSYNGSTGAGTIILAMSQTGMMWDNGGPVSIQGHIGGTTTGSVGYALYADDSNALYGMSTQLMSGSTAGPSFAADGGRTFNSIDGVFSLTSLVTITHPTNGATSFDFEAKVPEPATLALLGLGLLGLAGVNRRKAAAR